MRVKAELKIEVRERDYVFGERNCCECGLERGCVDFDISGTSFP